MRNKLRYALTAVILFIMPQAIFAQVPVLGTTSNFALFTAVGAFTNVGASTVTGDVGTNVGAFTGFPPGTLIGQSHVADPTSVVAAIDVDVAYNSMSGITCGVVLGTTLGYNQLLTPDVYCIGAASTLNGDLILDGLGNPNAIFIFKIDGALATATHANVILINSASLCNVFWQVNGAFELGDSSVFRGTVLANGAITLNTGATLNGRALSRAGAISISAVTVNIANCCSLKIYVKKEICPMDSTGKLTATAAGSGSFTYLWSNGKTTRQISYYTKGTYTVTVTDNGINACAVMVKSKYILPLGALFFMQTKVEPTCITCCDGAVINGHAIGGTPPYSYLWSDGNTNATRSDFCVGTIYLTITDANGCQLNVKKYFGKNFLRLSDAEVQKVFDVQLSPNPSTGNINLSIETENDAELSLKVSDITGRSIFAQGLSIASGKSIMPLDLSSLPAGIYYLNIKNNSAVKNIKFIKE